MSRGARSSQERTGDGTFGVLSWAKGTDLLWCLWVAPSQPALVLEIPLEAEKGPHCLQGRGFHPGVPLNGKAWVGQELSSNYPGPVPRRWGWPVGLGRVTGKWCEGNLRRKACGWALVAVEAALGGLTGGSRPRRSKRKITGDPLTEGDCRVAWPSWTQPYKGKNAPSK